MSEKVLGLKKAAVHVQTLNDGWCEITAYADDFVPVVSLEWLKKYCEENNVRFIKAAGTELHVFVPDLLLAAEKEAKRK